MVRAPATCDAIRKPSGRVMQETTAVLCRHVVDAVMLYMYACTAASASGEAELGVFATRVQGNVRALGLKNGKLTN